MMSLRAAVINRLRQSNTDAGQRVFQAFLAPAAAAAPYITVKLTARAGGALGRQPVECHLYAHLTSFNELDNLEQQVIDALHLQEITDASSARRYRLGYSGSAGDAVDQEFRLINRVVTFQAAHATI